jgi:hypothetical protein
MAKAKKQEESAELPQEAAVHSKDKQHVRTYSRAIHGDNFEELAHEFADRHGHEVRVL